MYANITIVKKVSYINRTFIDRNAGFIEYFKLTIKLLKTSGEIVNSLPVNIPFFTKLGFLYINFNKITLVVMY